MERAPDEVEHDVELHDADGDHDGPFHRFVQTVSDRRESIRHRRTLNLAYRIVVGVVGCAVLAAGIVAIPYPGPGWLIVFAGLGILASEFAWAHRVLTFAKGKYDAWMAWVSVQHWTIKAAFWLGTCAIVVFTLWLIGPLAMFAGWFGIEWSWLQSPVF